MGAFAAVEGVCDTPLHFYHLYVGDSLVAVVVILDNLNTLNRMEVKRMKIIVFKVRFKE